MNPLQAAWLGSKESINRITTRTNAEPPEFGEDHAIPEEDDILGDEQERVADSPPLRINTALTQLEEESAQLSALVSRASLHRASLPPHLIALPASMPVSPADGSFPPQSPTAGPRIPRSTSYASPVSGKVRGPRASMDLSLAREPNLTRSGSLDVTEARRRVHSEVPAGIWTLRTLSPSSGAQNTLAAPALYRAVSAQSTDSFVSAEEEPFIVPQEPTGHRPRKESQRSVASFATARSRA